MELRWLKMVIFIDNHLVLHQMVIFLMELSLGLLLRRMQWTLSERCLSFYNKRCKIGFLISGS